MMMMMMMIVTLINTTCSSARMNSPEIALQFENRAMHYGGWGIEVISVMSQAPSCGYGAQPPPPPAPVV